MLAPVLASLLTPALARADERAAVEPALRALLDQMERAVLAGDVEGYLALVARDDAVFWQEQRNWAADLKVHKPVEFSLTIEAAKSDKANEAGPEDGDGGRPAQPERPDPNAEDPAATTFGPERAVCRVVMAWRMGDEAVKPGGEPARLKARQIAYPVEFRRVDGSWRYAGEAWAAHGRPPDAATGFRGVRVRYAAGLREAAEAVAEAMPDVRAKVDGEFARTAEHVQEVKLYTSMLHLQASIYLSYADTVGTLGGWNEPGESVKILSRSTPGRDRLRVLLGHEYGHVATFDLGPKANDMPWWILEGMAEFSAGVAAGGTGLQAERAVRAWQRRGKLAAWSDLTDFRTVDATLTHNVYAQGEHFVRWFTARHGQAARNRWLTLMAQGATLDEATRTVTGADFGDADRAWRADVAKLAEPAEEKGD